MIRGLLWLPLLAVFCWLAWAGWNEYQKLESYRNWAEQFDHAKYDIYAVLGQKGSDLTWGRPSRQGPIDLHSFSLQQVESIGLRIGDVLVNGEQLAHPSEEAAYKQTKPTGRKGSIALEFQLRSVDLVVIPFTDRDLAAAWGKHLQQDWQQLHQQSA